MVQDLPKLLADPRFADVPIIGLTATPWTKGLGKHFDRLIVGSTTAQLIDDGLALPVPGIRSGITRPDGRPHDGGRLPRRRPRRGHEQDGAGRRRRRHLAERGEDRPTLCFAVDRAHAKNLQLQFLAAGISAEYIDAYTEAAERKAIAKRFHAGEVKVVCNVGCLTTGIDWDVRCIILARPTKSEMLYVQMIGRGLRTAEGKADCLILDHSDNHTRLGFVTDIHHEELDDGEPKRRSASRTRRGAAEEVHQVHLPQAAEDAAMPLLRVHPGAAAGCRAP